MCMVAAARSAGAAALASRSGRPSRRWRDFRASGSAVSHARALPPTTSHATPAMPPFTVHPPRGARAATPRAARSTGGRASRRAGARPDARVGARTSARVACGTRGWTGRAATSRATDSGLPLLVVSACLHRTRVSEMRGVAARRGPVAPSFRGRATPAAPRASALPPHARRGLASSVATAPEGAPSRG